MGAWLWESVLGGRLQGAWESGLALPGLDVYLTPVQMKKNRPGVLLSVTCSRAQAETLAALIFAETTTIGLRRQEVQRCALVRERVEVETPYGTVGVKVATLGGKVMTAAPDYEDCRRLAVESGVPLKEVYTAAEAALRRMDLPGDYPYLCGCLG